jgi:G3E family GTPase
MDNLGYMFGYMMERAMTMVAYCTFTAFLEKILKAEKEKVEEALGHVPTQENWQYYYELQQEKTNGQKARQREDDREKLRRLVFGEDSGSSEAG